MPTRSRRRGRVFLGQLLSEREPSYRNADVLVSTELRSVNEVVQHVIHPFRLARGQPSHR